ncbi:MAG: SpoIIE family protein phosphatase [Euzebyales bacterium]|nr:SpoIIE family protein phosphatase [Euzebyales bacterium]
MAHAEEPPDRAAAAMPVEQLEQLDAFLAGAPYGFALFDRDLRVVRCNASLASLRGLSPAQAAGRLLREVSPQLHSAIAALLREVLDEHTPVGERELAGTTAAGATRHWDVSAYPVKDPGGEVRWAAAVLLDVTERRRASDTLRLRAHQQAAVARIGLTALGGQPLGHLLTEAVRLTAETLGVDEAGVWQASDGDLVLRATYPPRPDQVNAVRLPAGKGSQSGHTLATDAPVVMRDAATETRFANEMVVDEPAVVSALTVVVQAKSRQFGVLGAYSTTSREFSDDDVNFVQSIANVVGAAVERRLADREVRTAAERLRLAQEAGRIGLWEWDLRSGRMVWTEALEQLYGIPAQGFEGTYEAFLRRVHPDDVDLVEPRLAKALEEGAYEAEHRIVRDDGETRWVVARGELVHDDSGDATGLTGVIVDISERKLVEQERAGLLRSEQAARAAAERARERLSFLAEVTSALASSLDYHQTLGALTRLSVPALADGCVVDLVIEDRLSAVAIAHTDAEKEVLIRELRRRYPPGSNPADPTHDVLKGGPSLLHGRLGEELLNAIARDEEHADILRRFEISSGILAPLVARGRVIGTLALTRAGGRRPFDSDDLALAEELGRRAALAIDNARLFAEAHRSGERYRRMAETLQTSLLPPHLPDVPGMDVAAGYRPAAIGAMVGGDFYDVFSLPDGAWGVVIGDVQGKGPEAATLTALARHTLRTAAMRQGAAETLGVLNDVYLATDESGVEEPRFCTVLYGRLDPGEDTTRLELVSGGHHPALVRRADGRVEALGGGGMLVGAFPSHEVAREATLLASGDTVVLYTDGVVEARCDGREFGEAGLCGVLCAAEGVDAAGLVARIEQAVMDFSEGRIRDDVAVLVLRVTG